MYPCLFFVRVDLKVNVMKHVQLGITVFSLYCNTFRVMPNLKRVIFGRSGSYTAQLFVCPV